MCHTARRFHAAASSYMGGIMGNELVASIPVPVNNESEDARRVVEDIDGIAREGNWCVKESSVNHSNFVQPEWQPTR